MNFKEKFTQEILTDIFPEDRADRFFDALYGDAGEGAYDISLWFVEHRKDQLFFEFRLKERPGKCMACNLTYGLPDVFVRHPIINIKGIVQDVIRILDGNASCADWTLGMTREISNELHVIPLIINLEG